MMKTVGTYLSEFQNGWDPDHLDMVKKGTSFCLFEGSNPLSTPGGNPFEHHGEQLIRALLTDMQLRHVAMDAGVSFARLFCLKRDIFDAEKASDRELPEEVESIFNSDPFISLKKSGNYSGLDLRPDDPLFNFTFNTLAGLVTKINEFAETLMQEISPEENEMHPFEALLRMNYIAMDGWKKAAMHLLSHLHGSGIVLPLALILGRITPSGYAKGLIALKKAESGLYGEICAQAADVISFLAVAQDEEKPEKTLQSLIQDGEGDQLEFKSTLRWDIRAGKTNQAIERACLKTISAFLNSNGGILLIGVRDDGSYEGIETDKFPNEDKFLLHLWTLVRTCLGRDFSPYLRTVLEKVADKTVCTVYCRPAARPAFLRQPGFPEEMYIRVGPSSNALDISEALKYISQRFPEN